MRSNPVKENHIGLVASEILWYTHTQILLLHHRDWQDYCLGKSWNAWRTRQCLLFWRLTTWILSYSGSCWNIFTQNPVHCCKKDHVPLLSMCQIQMVRIVAKIKTAETWTRCISANDSLPACCQARVGSTPCHARDVKMVHTDAMSGTWH